MGSRDEGQNFLGGDEEAFGKKVDLYIVRKLIQ